MNCRLGSARMYVQFLSKRDDFASSSGSTYRGCNRFVFVNVFVKAVVSRSLLSAVLVKLFLRRRQKGRRILLLGLSGAGKTLMFSRVSCLLVLLARISDLRAA